MAYVSIAEHFGKQDDMKKRNARETRHIAQLITLKACMKYSLSRVDSHEETRR